MLDERASDSPKVHGRSALPAKRLVQQPTTAASTPTAVTPARLLDTRTAGPVKGVDEVIEPSPTRREAAKALRVLRVLRGKR